MTSRPILAGELDRILYFYDMGEDWAALGYTLKCRIKNITTGAAYTDYNLSVVPGEEDQAYMNTNSNPFPTAGYYSLQVIAFLGGVERLKHKPETIRVYPNIT